MNLTKADKNDIHQVFEKKFLYPSEDDTTWPWPTLATSTQENNWNDEAFSRLRDQLNVCKDSLSDKDIKAWHAHTTVTNLAGSVCSTLRSNFKPELCTQAWCKFFEVLWSYHIVPLDDPELFTVHLCEAPGAFITCLNHYLANTAFTGKWRWVGTTLNPYYEGNDLAQMIVDDRLIRNTLPNWFFGDGTGNIMDNNNFQEFLQVIKSKGSVKLVTADGSIDCQNNPSEQESIVAHLHMCEVFTALHVLARGGSFVIKFFTMFEANSICLMYLLVKFFEKVNVFKPATSKQGNSEVYVVCLNYLGLNVCPEQEMLDMLQNIIFSESNLPDCLWDMSSIPVSFIESHFQCCRLFTGWQESVIKNNLRLYPCSVSMKKKLDVMRYHCCNEYLSRYPCHKIPHCNRLVNPYNLFIQNDDFLSLNFQTKHQGTFTQRMDYLSLSWKDQLNHFDLNEYKLPESSTVPLTKMKSSSPRNKSQLQILSGKPFSVIYSSRLCVIKLLDDLNTFLENCDCSAYLAKQSQSHFVHLSNTIKSLFDGSKTQTPLTSLVCCLKDDWILSELQIKELDTFQVDESSQDVPSWPFTMFVNATSSLGCLGKGEIRDKRLLLSKIMFALQNLKPGDNLIILTHTLMTRYSAGLILLTNDCFKKLEFHTSPARLSLLQLLVFSDFTSCHSNTAQHLQDINHWYETPKPNLQSPHDILEVISTENSADDVPFYNMVMGQNVKLLKSFLYSVLSLEKEHFSADG